jgi:microcystin-dependent protein
MPTGVQSWSKIPSNNATADSSVNWAEGMAPSAVNDSARAEMASVAKWRDDINGTLMTAGTAAAFTVISNQTFAALTAGLMVAFVPHVTSGVTPTLSVDGLSARPLRSAPGADLPSGVLSQGTPYAATYYSANGGEWILHGFFDYPGNIPIGGGLDYWGATAPSSNFVFAYGQALSRTTYATLFARLGTGYGGGDGSTTFNIPDCRGRVRAGKDDMGGASANRLTNQPGGLNGDVLGATGGTETHTLTEVQIPAHTHSITDPGHTHTGSGLGSSFGAQGGSGANQAAGSASILVNAATTGVSVNSTGGSSSHNNTQPTIVANYIIRAL